MIRELAENPNVHQPHAGGRELVHGSAGRYVVYLGRGTGPHSATVQRVRLAPGEVAAAVEEIRALLRDRGRGGSEWELGESSTPADLIEQLAELGILPDEDEPVAIGMVLTAGDGMAEPPGTSARRVESVDELVTARRIQHEAFGGSADDEVGFEQAEADFATEGEIGSTFLAFVDGEPVAAGYASYTPLGLLLFGGATLPSARGRGAYRALVAARAREAADRGTPVLVTHAGQMSRPILERLGFKPVSRIDRLLDVLPVGLGRLAPQRYSGYASPPDGNGDVAVHGHRGLDPVAAGARHRWLRGRAGGAPSRAARRVPAAGGVEVDTQGDAFFVAFPTASGAVAAATRRAGGARAGPDRGADGPPHGHAERRGRGLRRDRRPPRRPRRRPRPRRPGDPLGHDGSARGGSAPA